MEPEICRNRVSPNTGIIRLIEIEARVVFGLVAGHRFLRDQEEFLKKQDAVLWSKSSRDAPARHYFKERATVVMQPFRKAAPAAP